MRQFWGIVPATFLAFALLAGGLKISSKAKTQSGPPSAVFTPFILSQRVTHFSRNDEAVKYVDYTIARRSDGSLAKHFIVKDSDSPDGSEGNAVFIWDVPSRQNIMLEPFTKSAMTQIYSPEEVSDFLSSQNACSDAILSPHADRSTEQLLGYPVIRVEETSQTEHTVSWVAPKLDCFPLRKTVTLLDAKQPGRHSDSVVTSIQQGDPPDSLFVVPPEYSERSPLEIQSEYARISGGHQFFGNAVDQSAENIPVVSLPFEYFRRHIFVTLQINGSGQYSCIVDNGYQDDVINARAARAMGLQYQPGGGTARGLGDESGPEISVAEKEVTLGSQGFPMLRGQVLVLDGARMEKLMGRPIDCTIGAPLFERFVVEINFETHLLELYRHDSFTYRGQGHTVPLKAGIPASVQAEVLTWDGRKVKAIVGLDLGSDQAFEFQASFQSKHRILRTQQPQVSIAALGVAGEFHESMARLSSVDFAGFNVEKPLAEFLNVVPDPGLASRKDDGLVGNMLLQRFTVIFDQPGRRLFLEPNGSFHDPFTANMTGIGLNALSSPADGFDITSVDNGTVAAAAGVRAGDKILEINGVRCSALTFESLHQMLTAEGALFTLSIERGGRKTEISFQSPQLP
jgi:hypothetical protein